VPANFKFGYRALPEVEQRLAFQEVPYRAPVQAPVTLRPRRPDCRTFGAIEHPKLNAGSVGCSPHNPAQRVNLTHHRPLSNSANGGIAGHLTYGFEILSEKEGARPTTRGQSGGL
jgi:hypothetical protein